MEAVTGFLEGLTVFHWLGIGLILLTLEVAVGTFDLLWIAVAAFITALFALVMPLPLGGWQGQLTMFGVSGIALVWAGRTLFKGLRRAQTTHPNLNDRLANMVGRKGEAETSFENNRGKVKLGDSVWLAEQADETVIVEGDQVVVSGYDGTILKVKLV
ncbi:MAG TPA: NfeD family protein [Hyphomonadaceae bacterium]|jgi:membrane protein implicated in regulation of membrane protease activity|nr:NfeD family protein [Hyphomonadaceae bacterium]